MTAIIVHQHKYLTLMSLLNMYTKMCTTWQKYVGFSIKYTFYKPNFKSFVLQNAPLRVTKSVAFRDSRYLFI